jgi:hypothetical protein
MNKGLRDVVHISSSSTGFVESPQSWETGVIVRNPKWKFHRLKWTSPKVTSMEFQNGTLLERIQDLRFPHPVELASAVSVRICLQPFYFHLQRQGVGNGVENDFGRNFVPRSLFGRCVESKRP